MITHRNSTAKDGDVVAVQSNKGTIGYVKITDSTAKGHPSEGGHKCRQATAAEIQQALAANQLSFEG